MIEPTKNKDLNSQHEDLEGILSTGMRTTTYIEYWVVQWVGIKPTVMQRESRYDGDGKRI